jgi:hypothetical protein
MSRLRLKVAAAVYEQFSNSRLPCMGSFFIAMRGGRQMTDTDKAKKFGKGCLFSAVYLFLIIITLVLIDDYTESMPDIYVWATVICISAIPFALRKYRKQPLWGRYPLGRILGGMIAGLITVHILYTMTPEYQAKEAHEAQKEAAKVARQQANELAEAEAARKVQAEKNQLAQQLKAEQKQEDTKINNIIAKAKSEGVIQKIDCGNADGRWRNEVHVNPIAWQAMDLEIKQGFANVVLKYCETHGTGFGLVRIYNMMDGKELGNATENGLKVK